MFVVISDYRNGGQVQLSEIIYDKSIPDTAKFRVIDTSDMVVESVSKADIINCIRNNVKFSKDIKRGYDFCSWFIGYVLKSKLIENNIDNDINFKSQVLVRIEDYADLVPRFNYNPASRFKYYVKFICISEALSRYAILYYNSGEIDFPDHVFYVTKNKFLSLKPVPPNCYVEDIYEQEYEGYNIIMVKYLKRDFAMNIEVGGYESNTGKYLQSRKLSFIKSVVNKANNSSGGTKICRI